MNVYIIIANSRRVLSELKGIRIVTNLAHYQDRGTRKIKANAPAPEKPCRWGARACNKSICLPEDHTDLSTFVSKVHAYTTML